ncbi:unnamed protein product [Fraxinus pennsylvanica]|uniref:Uncharacterized protein n=1 Tax=Fraxinus pennsylvanica TaxID=56036 RepID=A0AAD2DRG5_9LAMI|nr:unnamed protein product [Fraxinus pennsylvanica]
MKSIGKEGIHEDNDVHRRSSFSGAINNKGSSSSSSNSSSGASSFSSSCSFNSNAFHEFHFLKRSSSATEIGGSIEAVIAHCKKSQLLFGSRNTYGFSSFTRTLFLLLLLLFLVQDVSCSHVGIKGNENTAHLK